MEDERGEAAGQEGVYGEVDGRVWGCKGRGLCALVGRGLLARTHACTRARARRQNIFNIVILNK